MRKIATVKGKVREFQVRNNFGRSDADNFAPWWLHTKFKLSDEEAANSCSDGSYDFGIDGFHMSKDGNSSHLALVQAKYSEDIAQVRKGVNDIVRFLPYLSKIISKQEPDARIENRLLRVLRSRVQDTEISESSPLEITGYVLTLCDAEKELVEAKIANAKEDLRKTFDREFKNPHLSFSLKLLTINDIMPDEEIIIRPATPQAIYFDGSEEIPMGESTFYAGIGRLSDLVNLYEQRGNQLFDKNIRLYIYGKKNESRGPAGKIKETLERIVNSKWPPEKFAFLHNGVTIYTKHIERNRDNCTVDLSQPSVLNGCQTIKASNFFYQDYKRKMSSEPPNWKGIPISIRIVRTDDETLWREVSESNNRQNAMKASALRANDPIQIELENRFRDMKIFYERQEQAFENISRSDFEQIEEVFAHSVKEPITIESLAQAIVCASNLSLAYASKQSDIFEQSNIYQRVFSEKHLRNLTFLVFAHNVRKVIDLAAEHAIPENTRKYEGFRPKRYRDLLTRLTLLCLVKNYEEETHLMHGEEVVSRRGKLAADLVEVLRGVLKSSGNPILKTVGDIYWSERKLQWMAQTDTDLLKICMKKLRIQNVDIFEEVKDVDYEMI
jgi:hypothetical protein